MEIFYKRIDCADFREVRPKICRKYLPTENFLTRKLGGKVCILSGDSVQLTGQDQLPSLCNVTILSGVLTIS